MGNRIEGNKLIAKFMDIHEVFVHKDRSGYEHLCKNIDDIEDIHILNYNSDWNLLMPVISKIENTWINGRMVIVNISKNGAIIYINKSSVSGETEYNKNDEIANTLNINYFANIPEEEISKIESVWRAVVDFIKYYNKNGK